MDFQSLVDLHYAALYRFAMSMTRTESDACDLVQQTFLTWATKGHQLQDKSKVKSWLFTTLHREFLNSLRRGHRFPHLEMESVAHELPSVPPAVETASDSTAVMKALTQVEEPYRAALLLFYLEDHSYREIAEILGVPEGTVMSRLSRGKALLRQLLADPPGADNPGQSSAKPPH